MYDELMCDVNINNILNNSKQNLSYYILRKQTQRERISVYIQ